MHLPGRTPTFAPLALVVLCFVSQAGFANPKNQIVATIPIGGGANSMVVSPDSKFVYVTEVVYPGATGIVQVIDTSTNTITATINLGTGPTLSPATMAVTPNGQTLYVADEFGPHLWVIDTATKNITTTLANEVHGLAVSPDGTELYACSPSGGTVLVIDTATNQITNTIQVGHTKNHFPWDVLFTLDGSTAFVAAKPNRDSHGKKNHGWLAVIDTTNQIVVASILLTTGRGIASDTPMEVLNPTGKQLFYSQERSIKVINVSGERVVRTMAQNFAHGVAAITPDGQFLYMVSAIGGVSGVSTIEATSGSVVGNQISFSFPLAVVIAPNGKFAYVSGFSASEGAIFVVDISPQ